MSNLNTTSFSEPITDPDILAGIEALPTPDDLPCDDGEPMETPRHRQQMEMLIQSLTPTGPSGPSITSGGICLSITTRSSATVFATTDFFLVLDVQNHERKSWVVWYEGMRFPDVIIELLSDSTP